MKLIDLTGRRFGRLLVVEKHGHKGKAVTWLCKCDCGSEVIVRGNDLRGGATQSCGCIHKEQLVERNTTHGLCGTRLYNIWGCMVQRCYNDKTPCYNLYGGRGITICEEWRCDFGAFYDWAMKHGYKDDLTIDRIENNKGYSPDNCRWITAKEQGNNRSTNRYLEFNGERHTISEWGELLGIDSETIASRLRRGWSIEKTLSKEIKI